MSCWLGSTSGSGRSAARTWVIDPIDGTKGFLAQRHYAIACGLLVDGQLQAGIVAAPGYANGVGALFYTRDGEAWRAPLNGGGGVKVRVSERRDVREFVAAQSFERAHASKSRMGARARIRRLGRCANHRDGQHGEVRPGRLRRCGSVHALAAGGQPPTRTRSGIHAAGVALVRAAGGIATDLDGGPLDFSQGETLPNAGMIVSNGQQHERVVEAVQRVMAE